METKNELNEVLLKNMNDAIERYRKRYYSGQIDSAEYERLVAWEKKNYESGGELYAKKLARALTPSPFWKW